MDKYQEKRAKLLEDKLDNLKPKVPQNWFVGLLWGLVAFIYLFAIVGLIILYAVAFDIKL